MFRFILLLSTIEMCIKNRHIIFYLLLLISFTAVHTKLLSVHTKTQVKPKIFGGDKANLEELNYQVSIQHADGYEYKHFCGGAIISTKIVLTAAHCFMVDGNLNSYDADMLRVVANMSYLPDADKGQVHSVEYLTLHEKYSGKNDKWNYDIAVLKVVHKFKTSPTLKPVPMRFRKTKLDDKCIISGWGLAHDKAPEPSRYLLKAAVSIIDTKACRRQYGPVININRILCTSSTLKDACQGDSGGPLVCEGELVGLVSYGTSCGDPSLPTVYTEVAKYVDWIMKAASNTNKVNYSMFLIFVLIFIVKLQFCLH